MIVSSTDPTVLTWTSPSTAVFFAFVDFFPLRSFGTLEAFSSSVGVGWCVFDSPLGKSCMMNAALFLTTTSELKKKLEISCQKLFLPIFFITKNLGVLIIIHRMLEEESKSLSSSRPRWLHCSIIISINGSSSSIPIASEPTKDSSGAMSLFTTSSLDVDGDSFLQYSIDRNVLIIEMMFFDITALKSELSSAPLVINVNRTPTHIFPLKLSSFELVWKKNNSSSESKLSSKLLRRSSLWILVHIFSAYVDNIARSFPLSSVAATPLSAARLTPPRGTGDSIRMSCSTATASSLSRK